MTERTQLLTGQKLSAGFWIFTYGGWSARALPYGSMPGEPSNNSRDGVTLFPEGTKCPRDVSYLSKSTTKTLGELVVHLIYRETSHRRFKNMHIFFRIVSDPPSFAQITFSAMLLQLQGLCPVGDSPPVRFRGTRLSGKGHVTCVLGEEIMNDMMPNTRFVDRQSSQSYLIILTIHQPTRRTIAITYYYRTSYPSLARRWVEETKN